MKGRSQPFVFGNAKIETMIAGEVAGAAERDVGRVEVNEITLLGAVDRFFKVHEFQFDIRQCL